MKKDELIRKFLANQCNAAEGNLVERMLESEPDMLERFLDEQEWEHPEGVDTEELLPLKAEIWENVITGTKVRTIERPIVKAVAIAASVLLMLATGYYWMSGNGGGSGQIAAQGDSLLIAYNHSAQIQQRSLEDGSVITLYPGASVQYSAHFKSDRRITLLKGKAAFEVAKDALHPFTVYSGNIATTALGTKFIVDQSGAKINVRLYEGKVVINQVNKGERPLKPAYLSAGEQWIANAKADGFAITSLNNEQFHKVLKDLKEPATRKAAFTATADLKFYNTPLSEAFGLLEELFDTHISYKSEEVSSIYFTGNFAAGDSLTHILHVLTSLNGLSRRDSGDSIEITIRPAATVASRQINIPAPVRTTREHGTRQYESTPLEQVFKEMEKTFGVMIRYEKEDVKEKYFTGSIATQDDLNVMLSIICKMNQLRVMRDTLGLGYRVIK